MLIKVVCVVVGWMRCAVCSAEVKEREGSEILLLL